MNEYDGLPQVVSVRRMPVRVLEILREADSVLRDSHLYEPLPYDVSMLRVSVGKAYRQAQEIAEREDREELARRRFVSERSSLHCAPFTDDQGRTVINECDADHPIRFKVGEYQVWARTQMHARSIAQAWVRAYVPIAAEVRS